MKAIVGVVSLLIVLAVVGLLARNQVRSIGVSGAAGSASAASRATDDAGPSVPQQARSVQQRVLDDTARTLQLGADRSASAAE